MSDGNVVVSIRERLLKERNALLDLSTRNRLLNTPLRTRNNRVIEVIDEKSIEVFQRLKEGKAFTFIPGVELSEAERAELQPDDIETAGIPQPDADEINEQGIAVRHVDLRLQTRLTSQGLQKRLFDIWYDARTLEDEQGVNILYLAIGLLRWFESDSSDVARHAPLVLLPVSLERTTAADKFKLKGRSEPPSPNLTLQAKLKSEFGLTIEDFDDEDDVDLENYCAKVAETVSKQARWEVLPNAMVLGFFSFAKFLMYRDLDPQNWPEGANIGDHNLIAALLRDGFPESEPLIAENVALDSAVPPLALTHVVDADSSQTVAIAEAAGGRTLVIKGPPGTGKSQTITNIIAAAATRGRKVLFVAEKMAALDVVYRRLRQVGLGPLALELHSNKANKRAVLDELRRTKDAVPRSPRGDESVIQKLGDTCGTLNAFAARLHTKLEPSGLTPHQIVGRLVSHFHKDAPAGFPLNGAESWNELAFGDRRRLVEELAERFVGLGSPTSHPWRGVCRDAMDPAESDALDRLLAATQAHFASSIEAARTATDVLGCEAPQTIADLDRVASWLGAAAELPTEFDVRALKDPAWIDRSAELGALVEAGERRARTREDAAGLVNEAGWAAQYDTLRRTLVTKGSSPFRFLNGAYRTQVALLRSYLLMPLPNAARARVAIVDRIVTAQNAKAEFDRGAEAGAAFGASWRGEASDWPLLRAVTHWRKRHESLPPPYWAQLAAAPDLQSLARAHEQIVRSTADLRTALTHVVSDLQLDLSRAFGVSESQNIGLHDLEERLALWRANLEACSRFIAFASRGRELERVGGSALVAATHDGLLDQHTLVPAFDRAYAEVLRTALFKAWPELRAFDGESQNRLVALFRKMDLARIELTREQILAQHAEARPRGNAGIGPLGVLNAEFAKKRGHLPIRQLLDKAGPAIQQLKPVFMMSPLSVAQFLKPGGLQFDVLVMDEASQIEPVDALGAVARVQQLVVVGDERQLPPTAFFKKLTGEDEADEDDDGVTLQAKDAESILDLCLAKGAPHRMLSWHYRSKHQSLIAVSNKEFYENKLYIVPSPYDAVAGMGLKFRLLTDAPYDRGGTRINLREARVVAEAVMQHAREHAEQSLGVATFSVAQRQAVLKELELLRRADASMEDFFSTSATEPFFVKNLENIQGDERDVIFISIGYGKNEQGYLAHAFGPLSGEGGERRLNVLISRAKLRCEVFSNFTGADIDLERTRSRGVAALKLFLTFAETGNFGLGEVSGMDHDSEFEAQVCDRLRSLGYDVKAQIGASGFRVDLAVGDSEKPGRFVLGIECDGAQYHSSRSARDRDRLRQQVLEAHGWIIHRIWSADWYLRPQEELKKVEAAIEAAKAIWRERDAAGYRSTQAVPISFEAEEEDDTYAVTATVSTAVNPNTFAIPYKEARFAVNRSVAPHEVSLADMAAYVFKIVEIEGPIHVDEIATRIRTLWGLQRAGNRIRAAVLRAADAAARRGIITDGPFHCLPNQTVVVRDRSAVTSASLRKPEMLPPQEIDAAMVKLIEGNFGATRDELIQAVARQFGFSATSAQLRAALDERVRQLLDDERLVEKGELLVRSTMPVDA